MDLIGNVKIRNVRSVRGINMHHWGDLDKDGNDICYQVSRAAEYIGRWLMFWARINVMQYKEKFGTVRVYCHTGWRSLYEIWRPGHYWTPAWWPHNLEHFLCYKLHILRPINVIIIPFHRRMYRWRYKQAIKKWPHLKEEILCSADWDELLEGL